jgi:DNA topoisomerase-3
MARGKDDDSDFHEDIASFVSDITQKIKRSGNLAVSSRLEATVKSVQPSIRPSSAPPKKVTERKIFGVCPACGKGNIIEGSRGFGCDRFREGCSYVVWKEFNGKKLTQAAIDLLISGKPTRVIKGFVLEDGRIVSGKLRMKEDRSGIELVVSGDSEV